MLRINRSEFEDLVREALEGLPQEFWDRIENVDVVVADRPSREQLIENGLGPGETLFGLYQGIPLTHRQGYGFVAPDKITIFQRPLEDHCDTQEELVEQVRSTVVHEVAHYFGISDEWLDEHGLD
ncbi:MAG: metallopeptidase family protein [Dehalococcoidia bacterium]